MAKGFEELDVYRLSEDLADRIWEMVLDWDQFAKFAMGGQIVRCADSIGANIAEGSGRGTYKDNCNFARIGRDSFNETRHFLRRAFKRGLLTEEQIEQLHPVVQELGPRLNAYIRVLASKAERQPKPKRSSNK
jgi:four helix bundle protein